MEKQLFEWSEFDQDGNCSFAFYDAVLLRDIGMLKKGERFDIAFLDFEKGTLKFYNNADAPGGSVELASFNLKLEIA